MSSKKTFISYSNKDVIFVKKLVEFLRNRGIQVWMDSEDLTAGSTWSDKIQEAITASERVIVVLSPHSVASKVATAEIFWAFEQNKLIIPIVIKECNVPLVIAPLHRINFTNGFEQGAEKLIKILITDKRESGQIGEVTTKKKLRLTMKKTPLPLVIIWLVITVILLLMWFFGRS